MWSGCPSRWSSPMSEERKKKRRLRGKSLTNMARKELLSHGNHGTGRADPTKPDPARKTGKSLQLG